jgi:hypothetical protein
MSQETPNLSANTREYVPANAFDDDKLDRKQLAEKLTGYLERLKDGAVLAIDAPWGEGKTWFGKNWNKDLNDKGFKTIYIDSFEQDYIEDPFLLITSEILNVVKDEAKNIEILKKNGVEVAKRLMPLAVKALVNFGGRFIGSSDLVGEIKSTFEASGDDSSDTKVIDDVSEAGEKIATDLTNKWISDKLDDFVNDKIIMNEFKTQLTTYAKSNDKPLVIFIDELDRCKPTFAVNLVERIKHFFDVPNIVFVLLLNKDQLEKAVKGVYGSETNACEYLDKFINFTFRLPKQSKLDHISKSKLKSFIQITLSKYNFKKTKETESFEIYLLDWSFYFKLSLRDIEKCVALFAFAYPTGNVTWILTYLIVFKIKNQSLFNRLINNETQAHKEAKDIIEEFIRIARNIGDTTCENNILPLYLEWHAAHESSFTVIGGNFQKFDIESMWGIDKKDYFTELAKMIDINIER